ncbi:MAG: hypothetical protein RR513_09335 [Muribaculaceae bacterium]
MNEIYIIIITAVLSWLGGFFIPKWTRKKENAEASNAEWQLYKDQLSDASERLETANERLDISYTKWAEISKLHAEAVLENANKTQTIADMSIELADQKKKNTMYKAENAILIKTIEDVNKRIGELEKTVDALKKTIEEKDAIISKNIHTDKTCIKRKTNEKSK